jgi:hypothetical protein
VPPRAEGLPTRRKLVYRLRAHIRTGSHRMFWVARVTRLPWLYTIWARTILRLYQALTYSRGPLGRSGRPTSSTKPLSTMLGCGLAPPTD